VVPDVAAVRPPASPPWLADVADGRSVLFISRLCNLHQSAH